MQGTGTQADPYIPTTWDEFVTAIGTSGAYVSLPEGGGTFDMNEIAPEGLANSVSVNCAQIDGSGWIIHAPHNIRFYSSYSECVINDLHFDKIYYTYESAVFRIYGGKFNRCTFTGEIAGGEYCYLFDEISALNKCSIKLSFSGEARSLFYGSAYKGLTMSIVKAELDYSGCTYTSTEMIDTDSDKKINDSLFEIRNCSLNLNFRGTRSVFHINGSGGYVRNSDGTKKIVTEEQLGSASYLNSVGYPIAAGGLS